MSVISEIRPALRFDDTHVQWRPFVDYPGLWYWVLGVNDTRQCVDLLFRLEPHSRCPSHRHVGPTNTTVLEGEHRNWSLKATGWELDQIRPPGYFASNEGDHLHSEQGGEEGTIVALNMTAVDGVIWEVLNDDGEVVATATIEDFRRAWQRQNPVPLRS